MSEHLAPSPKEGDIYKELLISGKPFRLFYGYYADFERESTFNEPMPIYPDFIREPLHTDNGTPFVTAMQDICPQYAGKDQGDSCSECTFFEKSEDLFGFCHCPKNKQLQP